MKEIIKYIFTFLTHRLFVLSLVLIFMISILLSRLFELQIINGSRLDEEFELSILREIDIKGQRGVIYDRKGTPLAINEIAYTVKYDNSVYSVDRNQLLLTMIRILNENGDQLSIEFPIYVNNDGIYQFKESQSQRTRFLKDIYASQMAKDPDFTMDQTPDEIIEYLCSATFFAIDEKEIEEKNISQAELIDLLSIRYALWKKAYYKFIPQEIAIDISFESLAELKENKDILPGVTIVEDPVRKYLYPELMSHILGYTGRISDEALEDYEAYGYDQNDIIGRIGIEKSMELYLHAQDGKQTVEVDNLGRTMNIIEQIDPVAGKDVYLTLDLELQKKTEEILVKQLAHLLSEKLVLKRPSYGEMRVPELREVYYSLFENKTIDLERILTSTDNTPSTYAILKEFQAYRNTRIENLRNQLETSDTSKNESLSRYNNYLLNTLASDGLLQNNHTSSSGFLDYDNQIISFRGLLNYYIKEDYLQFEKYSEDIFSDGDTINDNDLYLYLMEEIILGDYVERHQFQLNIFLEMIENEEFSYIDLSKLLMEIDLIEYDETRYDALSTRKISALNFMKDIIANIELTPQQVALDPSTGGAVITDVNTGAVLALVNYPSYDNNRISDYNYYQDLLNDPSRPLYPIATQGKTAPGSTFKMISAVAGLEEGIIEEHTHFNCTGHFTKVSPSVACWIAASGGQHGSINVVTAIAVSCNSFFNEVGYRLGTSEDGTYSPKLGTNKLAEYAAMFGLNSVTGIELTESPPSLPGNTTTGFPNPVTAAMGQEYNSYTPTQIARYIATLANGGTLYELTLIDRIYNSDGSVYEINEPTVTKDNKFSEETIRLVQKGMVEVTSGSRGTARSFYADFPLLVAGKTGSAQENKSRASHAVFGSFAPAEAPEIAITVVIPYSYTADFSSGFIVGTVTRDLYAAYYDIYKNDSSFNYMGENAFETIVSEEN